MTDDEQNAYADMLAMLVKIHGLLETDDIHNIYDEVGEVIAAAQAAAADETS